MKNLYLLVILLTPLFVSAQFTFSGAVADESGKAMPFATVALLNPADSTLAFFGITNDNGRFEVRKVKNGNYLLQVSYVGYTTWYHKLEVRKTTDFGLIILKARVIDLKETSIAGERIPLSIRNDTVEYNSSAFKTRPDAVTEDLLKKLPGVEVDRSGNIKAMGEDVKQVLVDGKEFFSSDPQVATKNLPADAISKVQVYDKKSEDAELTGIEDESRDKTINLLLKDGRRQAWLGELSAGAAPGNYYDISLKAYRFTAKNQFATLGMINNINKPGFSFRDYIDFNGGLQAMHGGGMRISFNTGDMPLNFGQTIEGLVTSGAGGINYSYQYGKNSRLFMSYLGNGSDKEIRKDIDNTNFTQTGSFTTSEIQNHNNRAFAHKLTFGMKDKTDTARTIMFNGNAGLTDGSDLVNDYAVARLSNDVVNILKTDASAGRDELSAGGILTGLFKGNELFKLVNLSLNGNWRSSASTDDRTTINTLPLIPASDHRHNIRESENQRANGGITASTLIRLNRQWYVNPKISTDYSRGSFSRKLKNLAQSEEPIDSLSPSITQQYMHLKPSIALRFSSKKTKASAGIELLTANTSNTLRDSTEVNDNYRKLLPFFNWEYNYRAGRRVGVEYSASLQEPDITLLVPVVNNTDPQYLIYGNRNLKAETRHDLFVNWMLFDQFSQTSLFTRIGGSITMDKIGYNRTIGEGLVQTDRLVNTGNEFSTNADVEFTTPLRFAGVNINVELFAELSRGEGLVNNESSATSNFRRTASLSFINRKTDHWVVEAGGELTLNTSTLTIGETITSRYINFNCFSNIEFNPSVKWQFSIAASVDRYTSQSFSNDLTIPMLTATAGYTFLKNNRGLLMLTGRDLLNKNTGISRLSQFNFISETRSNIIRRYIMLSFTYKLSPAKNNDRLDVKVK
ncbi:MAG: outer membrane beta-barrel protein [Chloroflexota bacterium]